MDKEKVVVRFAPSPTGYLHIGSARTAIVNYMFAKSMHPDSKFLLRIEDTDKGRNNQDCIDVIYKGLEWLNIQYDDTPILQSDNMSRHTQIAHSLILSKMAYYCFCSQDDLDQHRTLCKNTNSVQKYSGKCRCLTHDDMLLKRKTINPTIRIKVPDPDGMDNPYIVVNDMVKGQVKVHYNELDDFIILRSDGSPTYMLSVVVDDHDEGITHVIRGDDHFTNTFRQICIYNACGWTLPKYGHLSLIYGDDGKKLSKRRQVVGLADFKAMGYVSDAIRLYIGTMGAHVNLKTVSFASAVSSFNLKKMSKSPIQFDISFLNILNQQCIKSNKSYLSDSLPFIANIFGNDIKMDVLDRAYDDIASRSKTLVDFANLSLMYLDHNKTNDPRINSYMMVDLANILENYKFPTYDIQSIKKVLQDFVKANGYVNDVVFSSIRLALTGLDNTPNVCGIMWAIGLTECVVRLKSCI